MAPTAMAAAEAAERSIQKEREPGDRRALEWDPLVPPPGWNEERSVESRLSFVGWGFQKE